MNRKLLAIYLNDHYAGSTGGYDLSGRAAGANKGNEYGEFLSGLHVEIGEDRDALRGLMEELDIGVDRAKVLAAWAAEKAGRLKLNGSLVSYSPLSRLTELEGLSLGVSGKQSLWRCLQAVPDPEPALAEFDLAHYAERAQQQLDGLERMRRQAAVEALG